MPAINDRPLAHTANNGTRFSAPRCDLSGGLVAQLPAGLTEVRFAQDLVEFAAWHRGAIWEQLNGFQGYDCIQMTINRVPCPQCGTSHAPGANSRCSR